MLRCYMRDMFVFFESMLFFRCSQAHSMCLLPVCRTEYVRLVDMKIFRLALPDIKHYSSVSHSGQNFKPGLRAAEKRNPGKPVFSGFEMNAILSDETQYHCEITTVGPCTIDWRIIN